MIGDARELTKEEEQERRTRTCGEVKKRRDKEMRTQRRWSRRKRSTRMQKWGRGREMGVNMGRRRVREEMRKRRGGGELKIAATMRVGDMGSEKEEDELEIEEDGEGRGGRRKNRKRSTHEGD